MLTIARFLSGHHWFYTVLYIDASIVLLFSSLVLDDIYITIISYPANKRLLPEGLGGGEKGKGNDTSKIPFPFQIPLSFHMYV